MFVIFIKLRDTGGQGGHDSRRENKIISDRLTEERWNLHPASTIGRGSFAELLVQAWCCLHQGYVCFVGHKYLPPGEKGCVRVSTEAPTVSFKLHLFSPSDKGKAAARIPCLESLNLISSSGLKNIYILEFQVFSNLFSSRIAQGTSDSFCSMCCIPESDGCSWCFTLAEFSVHNHLYFFYLRSHLEPWAAS